MKNNNIKKTLSIAAAVAATASFVTANNVHADTVTNNQPATTAKDDSGIKPNQESTQATQAQATSSSDASTQATTTQTQAASSSDASTQATTTQTQAASSSVTQTQVDEAQNNVNETQSQINQNQQEQSNVKQQISDADSQISNIQNDYNNQNVQIDNNEAQIVGNYQNQINNIQNNQVNDEKQDLNNQISDLNGQVQTLQDQQSSSSQNDDNSKYTNVDGETVTPSADTQKVLDKIDTNADYMSNLYRNALIGDTTNDSHARTNGGRILSDTYGVTEETDSSDNYSLDAGGDDQLILDNTTTFKEYNQDNVIYNKLNDVDPIKNGQLTTDQERELAIIVADKLNNTREKLGLSRWVMTEKDFELAQRRASQQSAINLQHNVDDINSVFGGAYGENLALAFLHQGDNLNDVMRYVDASVAQLINSDKGNDYGHRDNILSQDGHIALGIKQVSNDTIMITMDWFDSDDEDGADLLALPAQLKAQGPTKKTTVVVDNSAKIAQLKSQIADLQTKLANVQFNYDKLSSSDKKNYDSLKNEIEVTHAKANNARNALKQNSQAAIDQVTQTKTGLYNTLYDLQDQMKTLQDKLVLQKTKLVQLQEELNNNKSEGSKTDDNKSTEGKTSEVQHTSYVSQRAKDAMMKALAETSERQAYTGDQIKYEDTAQNLDADRQEGTKRIIAAFNKLPENLRKFVTYMSFYKKQDGYYGLTDSLSGKTWLNTQYYNLNAFDQSYGTLYHEISHSIDGKTFYTADGVEYSLSRDAQIVPLLKEIAPNAPVFETWSNLFATYVMSRMHYQETVPTKDEKAMYYFDELLGEALFGSKAYTNKVHEDKKDNVAPVTPAKPSEDNKDNVAPVTPAKPSEDKKDNVAPVTPAKPSEDNKDNVAPVTPAKPSEDNKDNVAPVTPAKPSEDNKDNVAPVTPAKPSDSKSEDNKVVDNKSENKSDNGSSATDVAKQAINQTKGQTDFSDEKEDVIELPDGSKLVNVYSQNGLVRYSATVLKDGTVRNVHEQLVRKTSDGKTINVAQGQDGSQTVYVTDKNGNTQSVKFNNGNIVNYSRQATQPKSDLAQTGSSSNVSKTAALVEVALIFIAGLTGLAGIKLMKMKENK